MIIGFGNNVVSSLAADITATQTTIQVMPGAGALFAGLLTYDYANDSNPLKTYAKITLTDAKETVFEVCHLTSVSNDILTVVRGQEGTAKGWSLNDVIANFATRGSENHFVQIEQLQSGHYTSAVAGGTANGLTLALPATYFLNGSTEWALKTPVLIYPALNNTGASTLQLTMGGRVMGTYPLVKGNNTALRAGDIVAKNPFLAVFNAEQGRFNVLNPTTDIGSVRTVNSHAPDAAGNVKLGSAADADLGTDSPDQVLSVGDYGLAKTLAALNGTDLNTVQTFGFYVIQNPVNAPAGSNTGTVFLQVMTWQSGTGTAGYRVIQELIGYGQSGSSSNRVWRRTYVGTTWSDWQEFYSEAHKPSPSEIGAANLNGDSNVDFYVRDNGDATAAVNNARLNFMLQGYAWRGGDASRGFAVAGGSEPNSAVAYNQFQSGNNGNGAWTKLPGGGQWCRQNINLSANANTTWTFPASFPGTPGIYITTFNGAFQCWLNGAGPSDCGIYNNGPALNVNVFAVW